MKRKLIRIASATTCGLAANYLLALMWLPSFYKKPALAITVLTIVVITSAAVTIKYRK